MRIHSQVWIAIAVSLSLAVGTLAVTITWDRVGRSIRGLIGYGTA